MPLHAFFFWGGDLCWHTDWSLNHKDTSFNKHSVVNGPCCWFLEIYKKVVIKSQKESVKSTWWMVNSQAKKNTNNLTTLKPNHRQSHKTWFHQITSRWTFFFRLTSPWIWISLREIWTSRLSTKGHFAGFSATCLKWSIRTTCKILHLYASNGCRDRGDPFQYLKTLWVLGTFLFDLVT